MEIEDMGNAVKIGKKIIPAWNIQVDGFPQEIDGHSYGIYFEIPFETGILWMIDCHDEAAVVVNEYKYLGTESDREYSSIKFWIARGWNEFLNEYESYLNETLRAA